MVDKKKVYLIFNEVLCSTTMINDFILDNLIQLSKRELKQVESALPDANIIPIEEKDIFSFRSSFSAPFVFRKNQRHILTVAVRGAVNAVVFLKLPYYDVQRQAAFSFSAQSLPAPHFLALYSAAFIAVGRGAGGQFRSAAAAVERLNGGNIRA